MFEVAPGCEAKAMEKRHAARITALRLGMLSETRYLNGGSQTRRDTADDIIGLYTAMGIAVRRLGGWAVVIGNDPMARSSSESLTA